jgi:acetyl-CoA synthetase
MARVGENLGIPVAVAGILPEGLDPPLRRHLLDRDIAPLLGFSDTLEALAVAARIGENRRQMTTSTVPGELLTRYDTVHSSVPSILLDEAESKAALAARGLVTPAFRVASRDQAAFAAAEIGFPVALKLVSNEIAHKAKMGGVRLGLESADAVDDAVQAIDAAAIAFNGKPVERFLVEAMVDAPRGEYIIGVKQQPALGLALMIGRGGVDVENQNRHATVLLPLVQRDLDKALQDIGLGDGVPGYEAMLDAIRAVAAYAVDNRARLRSLDVNPLIVSASGAAIAADALIEVTRE